MQIKLSPKELNNLIKKKITHPVRIASIGENALNVELDVKIIVVNKTFRLKLYDFTVNKNILVLKISGMHSSIINLASSFIKIAGIDLTDDTATINIKKLLPDNLPLKVDVTEVVPENGCLTINADVELL